MKALLTILLLISFNSEIFSQPTIYHVRTDGDDSNTGLSWTEAFSTVQKALDSADTLDQIWVAEGTYHPTSDHGLDAEEEGDNVEQERLKHFRMKNGVAIYGGFPSAGNPNMNDRDWENNATVLSGDFNNDDEYVEHDWGHGGWRLRNMEENAYHVFYHPAGLNLDSTAVLDGVIITGGNADFYGGGGMYNKESHPTIKNSVFKKNRAFGSGGAIYNKYSNPGIDHCQFIQNLGKQDGGAIYNHHSNPDIKHSKFLGNSSPWGNGGGIFNHYSDPIIENCLFVQNELTQDGGSGGGINNFNSNPHIKNSVFKSNDAYSGGGGISNISSNPIIEECVFRINSAWYAGGAISNRNSNPVIKNTIILNNGTMDWDFGGGGVYNSGSNPTILNTVIAGNNSAVFGGGILNEDSSPVLINTIIANNNSFDAGGGIYNGIGSHSIIINSIIWGNREIAYDQGNQIHNDDNSSATLDYSIYSDEIREGGGFTATNSITDDPLFVGTEVNPDHPYLVYGNSPAVDAGSNELLPEDIEFDIRGEPRIVTGTVDIGPYEWQPEIDPTLASITSVAIPPFYDIDPIPFWIEVEVGDLHEIIDLYGVSFNLRSHNTECIYVEGSAEEGPFLGSSLLFFSEKIDDHTVDIAVSRTSPPGVSGSGIVARAQFIASAPLSEKIEVEFTLENTSAINSEGVTIILDPEVLKITIIPGVAVWPGDTNNDGIVNSADILPIGLYYGQSFGSVNNPGIKWESYMRNPWSLDGDTPARVYADADGSGVIDAADVLAIGVNYGKENPSAPSKMDKLYKFVADDVSGQLYPELIPAQHSTEYLLNINLKSIESMYGISFKTFIKINDEISDAIKLGEVDYSSGVLDDVLSFSQFVSDKGFIDIGITRTDGDGFVGEGKILSIPLKLSGDIKGDDLLDILIDDIVAINEDGEQLYFKPSSLTSYLSGKDLLPKEFTLHQNYPNPFNPSTTITFAIPVESLVRIEIYDILGRRVTTLLNEIMIIGNHQIEWNTVTTTGYDIGSGMYIYRMTADPVDGSDSYSAIKRMVFIK